MHQRALMSLVIVLQAALLSCTADSGQRIHTLEEMRPALNALMTRTNFDAFVIFTIPASGQFVQFGGRNGDLLFDLPETILGPEELERATRALGARGIRVVESPTHSITGEETGTIRHFSRNVGKDVDAAIDLARLVLEEVYRYDVEDGLEVEEN